MFMNICGELTNMMISWLIDHICVEFERFYLLNIISFVYEDFYVCGVV